MSSHSTQGHIRLFNGEPHVVKTTKGERSPRDTTIHTTSCFTITAICDSHWVRLPLLASHARIALKCPVASSIVSVDHRRRIVSRRIVRMRPWLAW